MTKKITKKMCIYFSIVALFLILVLFFPIKLFSPSPKIIEDKLAKAILNGDISEIQDILDNYNVDLESKDSLRDPMLHIALRYGYVSRNKTFKVEKNPKKRGKVIYNVVSILLNKGANVNSFDKHKYTPLCLAVRRANTCKVAELLIENGADINLKCESGNTPLHLAVQYSNPAQVKLLLDKGANISEKNDAGQTPIDIAKEQDCKEIIELLLKYKTDN